MISHDASKHPLKTSEEIEAELARLASEIERLKVVTMAAGFTGVAVGSVLTIPLGPIAFAVGSAVGAIAAGGISLYSQEKKKSIREEISSLLDKGAISAEKSTELSLELDSIHTDKLQKPESSTSTTEKSPETEE